MWHCCCYGGGGGGDGLGCVEWWVCTHVGVQDRTGQDVPPPAQTVNNEQQIIILITSLSLSLSLAADCDKSLNEIFCWVDKYCISLWEFTQISITRQWDIPISPAIFIVIVCLVIISQLRLRIDIFLSPPACVDVRDERRRGWGRRVYTLCTAGVV